MSSNSEDFFDLIDIISVLIGLQNLQENREQSAHNDVQSANAIQAKFLLNELTKQFEKQNEMLKEILIILKKEKTKND